MDRILVYEINDEGSNPSGGTILLMVIWCSGSIT